VNSSALLAKKPQPGGLAARAPSATKLPRAGSPPARLPWFIQPSLRIGPAHDPLEQEADRVADQVTQAASPATLQRKCACERTGAACPECEQESAGAAAPVVQRSATRDLDSNTMAPQVALDAATREGRPLDPGLRELFEPRFGRSFKNVRIHDDAAAAKAADSVGARAYTIGNHLVFGAGEYVPNTTSGRRTLAHELTHVIQQRALPASQHLQRDLATPPPAAAAPAQPDLTDDQIAAAIAFNRAHYNAANTTLIQDLLGGPVTGDWTADNIIAIAATQEEFGLTKDGKVGHDTFTFLNREQQLEGAGTGAACLTSFEVQVRGPNFQRLNPAQCQFDNALAINAEFSQRCNCAQFQYRQFIRGHLLRTRGGVVTDLGAVFLHEVGGALPAAFAEDADTSDPVPNYGHRDVAAGGNVEDHYINDGGGDDQANGCRYRATDDPNATINDCQPGDSYDVEMNFRGEIQRNGAPIQTKFWGAFHRPNWQP
jgi:hypothetical protein